MVSCSFLAASFMASSSSSSSCCATSNDFPNSLSPFLYIVHYIRSVFQTTSGVHIELL